MSNYFIIICTFKNIIFIKIIIFKNQFYFPWFTFFFFVSCLLLLITPAKLQFGFPPPLLHAIFFWTSLQPASLNSLLSRFSPFPPSFFLRNTTAAPLPLLHSQFPPATPQQTHTPLLIRTSHPQFQLSPVSLHSHSTALLTATISRHFTAPALSSRLTYTVKTTPYFSFCLFSSHSMFFFSLVLSRLPTRLRVVRVLTVTESTESTESAISSCWVLSFSWVLTFQRIIVLVLNC